MARACGLLHGTDLQYLDHIAPLSSILEIPLFFTDLELEALCRTYYPHLETHLLSPLTFSEKIVKEFEVVFSCLPKEFLDPLFFFDEHKFRKKLLSIWLPHGNSDKDNLGGLKNEKLVLVYGNQMIDTLKRKEVFENLFCAVTIGNFRKQFFEKHIGFYKNEVMSKLTFSKKQKTLFYAPTWQANETPKSIMHVLDTLPDEYNMIVKLHPNTCLQGFYHHLLERYKGRSNLLFIDKISTIYPILASTDVYIGDNSSIAYDFLAFDKPLFFLTKTTSMIHHTGMSVTLDNLYTSLLIEDKYSAARNEIYTYAFDANTKIDTLPLTIKKAYVEYFDSGVHFL